MEVATSSIQTPAIPPQAVSNMTIPAPGSIDAKADPKAAEKPESTEPKEKKVKLIKVDGKEIEIDEDTLVQRAQKSFSAEKRLAEAHKLMQQIQARADEITKKEQEINEKAKKYSGDEGTLEYLIQEAQNDPQKLGKVRDRVEKWLIEQIKLESQSPEQQELLRAKQELQKRNAELDNYKKTEQQKELEALTATHRKTIEATIVEALKLSNLPANEWNVKHMADLMQKSIQGKYQVSPQQLADMVRADRVDNTKAIIGDFSSQILAAHKAGDVQRIMMLGQSMEDFAGQDYLNAIRLYDLAKLKSAQPQVPKPVVDGGLPKTSEQPKKSYELTWEQEKERRRNVALQLEQESKRR